MCEDFLSQRFLVLRPNPRQSPFDAAWERGMPWVSEKDVRQCCVMRGFEGVMKRVTLTSFSCFGKMLLTSVFAQQLWACVTVYVVIMIVSFSLIHLNINCSPMLPVLVAEPFYPLSSCPRRSSGDRNISTAWSLWRSTSEPTSTSRKAARPLAVLRARPVTPSRPLLPPLHPLGRSTAQMTCERDAFITSRIQVKVYTLILILFTREMGLLLCNESKIELGLWEMLSSLRAGFQAEKFKDEVMF